jgi:hypothetical protein
MMLWSCWWCYDNDNDDVQDAGLDEHAVGGDQDNDDKMVMAMVW